MATLAEMARQIGRGGNNYKFLDKLNIKRIDTPYRGKGYAETWPVGEEGAPSWLMRPNDIPMQQNGIQVFQPDKWTENDTAGEGLHIDPMAHEYRTKLLGSMTDEQMHGLKNKFLDYDMSAGMPETNKINNLIDAAMRGYTVGQAPKEFNQSFYRPDQKETLNQLKRYMQTGVKQGGSIADYLRNNGDIR